jgi:hypothetical protein
MRRLEGVEIVEYEAMVSRCDLAKPVRCLDIVELFRGKSALMLPRRVEEQEITHIQHVTTI